LKDHDQYHIGSIKGRSFDN